MRFKIIFAALGLLAIPSPSSAQPDYIDGKEWREVVRTSIGMGEGKPDNASVTFMETGFERVRAGNAVRFEIVTVLKRPMEARGHILDWHDFVADCSTGHVSLIGAWAQTGRSWAPMITRGAPSGPVRADSYHGRLVQAACGAVALNGEAITHPLRAARRLFPR